jgi:hypothetical protein
VRLETRPHDSSNNSRTQANGSKRSDIDFYHLPEHQQAGITVGANGDKFGRPPAPEAP